MNVTEGLDFQLRMCGGALCYFLYSRLSGSQPDLFPRSEITVECCKSLILTLYNGCYYHSVQVFETNSLLSQYEILEKLVT